MKNKNIYIIRHGQTDFNLNKMVQGRGIDSSLNETGKRQAGQFYENFIGTKLDKVYTSSLKRTVESVQGFLDSGLPHESLSGLDEISWGDHEGLTYDPERHQHYLHALEMWKSGDIDHRVANGESPNEVAARQKEAIDYIMSKDTEESILISTHGRAMRILVCWMMGRPLHEAEAYEHANLCLYHLEFDGNGYQMVVENSTEHLE